MNIEKKIEMNNNFEEVVRKFRNLIGKFKEIQKYSITDDIPNDKYFNLIQNKNDNLKIYLESIILLNKEEMEFIKLMTDSWKKYYFNDINNFELFFKNEKEFILEIIKLYPIDDKQICINYMNIFIKIKNTFDNVHRIFGILKLIKIFNFLDNVYDEIDNYLISKTDIDIEDKIYKLIIKLLVLIKNNIDKQKSKSIWNKGIINFLNSKKKDISKLELTIESIRSKTYFSKELNLCKIEIESFKLKVKKLNDEILELLPKTKKLEYDNFFRLVEERSILTDNFLEIKRNFKRVIPNIDIEIFIQLQKNSNMLYQKFIQIQEFKNDSDVGMS